jgi:hypothetical protein
MRAACRLAGGLVLVAALSFGTAGCGGSSKAASNVALQVAAPQDGGSVNADRVTVRGTVTPANATVQILGKPAQVGNGVFVGSVPLHAGSNTIDIVASAAGSTPSTTTITVTRKSAHHRRRTVVKSAPPISQKTDCGNGLTVGPNTSCAFAQNVQGSYESSGAGSLDVYSPTTGQTYRMYCTSGPTVVCTGGHGASVYFTTGSSNPTYSVSDCGGGLLVGPNTSCAFGSNVQEAYYRFGAGWIRVFSPVTGRTYNMYCTSGSPVVCTGGNNAAVYFG